MIELAAYIVLATAPQQGTKTYSDKSMDLTFQRPADWVYKKNKYMEQFEFGVSDGTKATVQIFKTSFRQAPETWQDLQLQVATQMGRAVAKQWEEQILAVPLMMSRIEYTEASVEKATVVGLLYTATADKLNFRINSTKSTIDEAEEAWRSSLMTLRTLSGQLPVKDDPTKPLIKPDTNEKGQKISRLTEESIAPTVKRDNAATIFTLGRKVLVTLPKGWTIEQEEENAVLRSPELPGPITLAITPGSEKIAEDLLSQMNAEMVSKFKLVTLRDQTVWKTNSAGAKTLTSYRTGPDTQDGTRFSWASVGAKSGLVWSLEFTTLDEKESKAIRKSIENLVASLGLEFES